MEIRCHYITILLKCQSYNEIYNSSSHILSGFLLCFNLGYHYIARAITEISFGIYKTAR